MSVVSLNKPEGYFADRVCKDVPEPAHRALTNAELFDSKTKLPRVDVLQEHFLHEGRLSKADALSIIRSATDLLKKEPNMLSIDAPGNNHKGERKDKGKTRILSQKIEFLLVLAQSLCVAIRTVSTMT
jgi:hypothetical protein